MEKEKSIMAEWNIFSFEKKSIKGEQIKWITYTHIASLSNWNVSFDIADFILYLLQP